MQLPNEICDSFGFLSIQICLSCDMINPNQRWMYVRLDSVVCGAICRERREKCRRSQLSIYITTVTSTSPTTAAASTCHSFPYRLVGILCVRELSACSSAHIFSDCTHCTCSPFFDALVTLSQKQDKRNLYTS